ncbi:hypothetical protein AVEN_33858-1 [Araneus ventricosus]|uniref:Uncharacterized protein n=1 Tax=Araneus ventricosus TaxID=182803 RepID=A0A4Y2UQA1_ARAVE|nr:hypothetical protein AVEN_33858-1 [Araneus ventricosus]
MPRWNPFQLPTYIKKTIAEHPNITNMKYSRQGKLLFSTSDPVCAAKLLALQTVLDTKVSTDVIWENISSRFLIPDIPTTTTLEELVNELSCNIDIVITHMRRFVKPNSSQETSPVLVTILGTYLPDSVKIWFIKTKNSAFQYTDHCNVLSVSAFSIQPEFAKNPKLATYMVQFMMVHVKGLQPFYFAILVCSKLTRSLKQVNASFEVTMGRICSKPAASNSLQIIAKTEYEHNPD